MQASKLKAVPDVNGETATPVLRASGVTLQYKTPDHLVTATYRVSFDIMRGDRYVILGPSGCGKSTILKAIAGFLKPVEGTILLKGKKVKEPGPDRMMVFQEFDQLLPWKTVKKNIMFPMTENGVSRAEAEERARQVIEQVNLTAFVDAYPHMLSGGMKQRCAIARAMAMRPAVLLMDEPYASLYRRVRHPFDRGSGDRRFAHSGALSASRPSAGRAEQPGLSACRARWHRIPEPGAADQHHAAARRAQTNLTERTMSDAAFNITPFVRAEFEHEVTIPKEIGDVEQPLSFLERMWNSTTVRRTVILVLLALVWEAYARWSNNPLLFPTFTETIEAWWDGINSGVIPQRLAVTLRMLAMGYGIGLALAALFVTVAVSTRIGTDLLSTLTAMFNPLPAIALLPLALLWFGLGPPAIIFVIVNSVLWAVALNTHIGCMAVSMTLRMAGQTFGLKGFRYVVKILMPAAFPAILSGLKIGWAFAWRTLIAAELVFGVSSGSGGLGWYIFENRNLLDTANVFAGLLTVMAVGLFVESLVFRTIERKTVRRWGMQHG